MYPCFPYICIRVTYDTYVSIHDGRARKRDPKAIDESELPPPEPFKRPDSWPEQLEGEDHDTYMARVIASIRCGLPDETKRPTPPNPDGANDDD